MSLPKEEDDEAEEEEGKREVTGDATGRKEKRKVKKKEKRRSLRREMALKAREEEEALLNDPEEQRRAEMKEKEEEERAERERKAFEERERIWSEKAAAMAEMQRKKAIEDESSRSVGFHENLEGAREGDDTRCSSGENEEGPPEIIWQGNEIIVKKKKIKPQKKTSEDHEVVSNPSSNPFPPYSEALSQNTNGTLVSAQETFENFAQLIPSFGTEQDKTHCPFQIKTGVCRFGSRCSRVHVHPDKSFTLLIKNMYNGPGLAWEQDEGLEHTEEEVELCYTEFYEDVHTEFLKFGEIINFKVCRNGSLHLRGNVYVHYKNMESAINSYNVVNGRYFAGKQMNCEFVGVTRWKLAICGEFMKSRHKTCSRGTTCNFLHPFRNPGGEYEWADWEKTPPVYWVERMAFLFGPSEGAPEMDPTEHERQDFNSKKESTSKRSRHNKRLTSDKRHSSNSRTEYSDESRSTRRSVKNSHSHHQHFPEDDHSDRDSRTRDLRTNSSKRRDNDGHSNDEINSRYDLPQHKGFSSRDSPDDKHHQSARHRSRHHSKRHRSETTKGREHRDLKLE